MSRYRYRCRGSWREVAIAAAAGLVLAGAAHASGGGASAAGGMPAPAAVAAVAYAKAQVRARAGYCWAGTGPSCFDCSGLVMEAYAPTGIELPHNAGLQWVEGHHVAHPRPGDLVFFPGADGTWDAPGHVGIVVGPHLMIDAYDTGVPVRYDTFGEPTSAAGLDEVAGFTRPSAGVG
jgi:cell wall-associated NlpC family hydrolase